MVDINKVRIKKSTFRFDVRKRYQYSRHFKAKIKSPLERIMDHFKYGRKQKKQIAQITTTQTQATPKNGMNLTIIGIALVLAVLVLGLGWVFLSAQVAQITAAGPAIMTVTPSMSNMVAGGSVLTDGDVGSTQNVGAVLVNYNTQNLDNYSVNLTTYAENIPSEIFVLSGDNIQATTYPEFITALRNDLSQEKIVVNEISLKELETIPEGAVVIVPSGAVPQQLLGVGSTMSMDSLADKGVVVIYIGQPFTSMISSGSLVVNTPQSVLDGLPVAFDQSPPSPSTDDFSLFQPLYTATAKGGGWSSLTAYGSVSIAKKGDGAFVFLPQTLDAGWRGDSASAANDVSTVIFQTPWDTPTADSNNYTLTSQTDGNLSSGSRYFFTSPFTGNETTVKLEFTGYSSLSNNPVHQILYTRLQNNVLGSLYVLGGSTVVSSNVTDQPARFSATLREPVAAQPSMNLIILNSNGTVVQNIPQGNVNVQGVLPFDVQLYLDKGEYLAELADDNGKNYAQAYLNVVSVDVELLAISQSDPSDYTFGFYQNGQQMQGLNSVTVTVDNGTYGTYSYNNVGGQIDVNVGNYTGNQLLPYGTHDFQFKIGSLTIDYPWIYERPAGIPIEFVIIILLSIGIAAAGILFARPEQIFFSLDIPDFPPVARTKVGISKDVVLAIFEKMNETYRWQTTPLMASEIKNGFKTIFVRGNPIVITDYNVDFLLDDIVRTGEVKEAMGYYGLTSWEAKTRHSIVYLAMMRKLRDICVNNAVPFTGLGESQNADSEITVAGQQMYLHFFEKDIDPTITLSHVLTSVKRGITIVLFKNQTDKEAFSTLISSPSVATLLVKMEVEGGSIQLSLFSELEKMIQEFKSM